MPPRLTPQESIEAIAASINRRGSAAIVEELKSTMTATLPRSSLAEFETDADGSQPGDRDADLSNEVTKESPFARTDRPIPAAVAGDRNERPIGAAARWRRRSIVVIESTAHTTYGMAHGACSSGTGQRPSPAVPKKVMVPSLSTCIFRTTRGTTFVSVSGLGSPWLTSTGR